MWDFIILLTLAFAIFGLTEFLHILKLFIIFPKRKMNSHLIINLQNNLAESQLTYVCEQYRWLGTQYAENIHLICDYIDDDTYFRCKQIADKYGITIKRKFDL